MNMRAKNTPRFRPPAIWAIGRNYLEHAQEMTAAGDGAAATSASGSAPDERRPTVFMKNPASVIGDGEPIVIPAICDEPHPQVDYEGELAVILDRDARDVAEDEALGYVRGYAAANDVSARWWQKHGSGGQFIRGKSFDTFCPIGSVAEAAQVGDPQTLRLETRLNGEVVQSASTAAMMFPVMRLIAELSRGTTLLAGSVILTGTPAGVGFARTPPRFLQPGDVVSVRIERVGSVTNPVEHDG